jgi:IclR family mhp operon transcriptional activator
MSSFKPVIAVCRALEVLRVVNEQAGSTVRSIHHATGLDQATIVRMLETLEHQGYVARDGERATYAPTGQTLLLSQGFDKLPWIAGVAEPTLSAFRNRIGWPSDIAFFDRDAMVLVQTSRGSGPLSFNRRAGFRAPVLMTSVGLAYLASCPAEERRKIIAALAQIPGPWHKSARAPARLEQALATVRQQGYAVMADAYAEEVYAGSVWALGVPIMHGGMVFAAMNIMMLRNAVSLKDAIRNLLAPLQQAAAEIAAGLAASQPGKVAPAGLKPLRPPAAARRAAAAASLEDDAGQ